MQNLRWTWIVAAALASGGVASAAPAWRDGPLANNLTACGPNSSTVGTATSVGYMVDPVAGTPKLNQVFYVHALAANLACSNEVVGFDFILPPGASFAVSQQNPVICTVNQGSSTVPGTGSCLQTPVTSGTNFGGAFFGSESNLKPGQTFEIRVPVVFGQIANAASLRIGTSSSFGPLIAGVDATVPFMPRPFGAGADIALLGSATAGSTLPVAFSNDDGSFTVTSYDVGDFATWTRDTNVQRISGDFNGDGLTDFTLFGGPNWGKIPVAMSLGDGRFSITNTNAGWFPIWASTPGIKVVTGDFNRDQRTDIALLGGPGWTAIPIAFSNGDGTFNVTNVQSPSFAGWAGWSGAKPLVGDFNKDGADDIALVGGAGWTTIPVALSYGNGNFAVTNYSAQAGYNGIVPGWNFAILASAPGVTAVTGDFNHDGFADIALAGGAGWASIPIAFSYGNGAFALYNQPITSFASWASTPGAKVLTGDFNGDGWTDLALTGVAGWLSVPVALNVGYGSFNVVNSLAGTFATQASMPGVRAIAADFNGDGYTDVALTGGSLTSIPVAFSVGWGLFNVTNTAVAGFGGWASDTTASALVGHVN